MSDLSICRICLVSEAQMRDIENTDYQMIYEKMCSNKLQTEDGRPSQVCYLCYIDLKKCHELVTKLMKSDDLLPSALSTKLTNSSIKNIDRQHYKLTENLSISHVDFNNMLEHDIQEVVLKEVIVKEELIIKKEVTDNLENDNIDVTKEDSKTDHHEIISATKYQAKGLSKNGEPFDCSLYKCEMCCKRFVYLKDYNNHREKHNKDNGKTYSCTVCDYTCSHNGRLKAHLRKHTGDKPYSCTLCEYKSTQKANLKRHMMKHTGEKPYSCTLCNYKCVDNGHLKVHMRKHDEKQTYSCTVCEYTCSHNGHLKAHMRKHKTL